MSYIQTAASGGPLVPANFANPTASVGLTAVNGSAITAMRSDGAPALDQTAAFAFSGLATTVISQAASAAVPLTISGYSLTSAQQQSGLSFSGTLNTSGSPDVIKISITDTARGASTKLLNIYAGSAGTTSVFSVDRVGATSVASGTFTVNSFGNVTGGNSSYTLTGTGLYTINSGEFGWSSTGGSGGTVDTWLTRAGAAKIQLGQANAASPVAQTLQAQGSRAGTDVSTAGANFTAQSGIGTGNVLTSSFIINGIVGNATTTTTAQTTAAGITVPGVVSGQLPGAVIGSAAIATNATDGFLYITSGTGPPTGTPTAFTGRVPFYYDSTNDQLYIYRGGWKQPKTPAGAAIVNWQ